MSSQSRFSDPAYIAWLRDTLALLYLKEGIEDITNAVATKFHDDLKLALGGSTCSSCSPRDMIKDTHGGRWYMNCQACDAWLQKIASNHGSQPLPNIHRDTTDPQLWPTDPWEVLKCYMGYGCQGIHSAKDADTQNLLTLFKNCPQFDTGGQITRIDLIDELLKIRNSLFHSGDMHVDEKDLQKHMQTMLHFLAGVTCQSQAVTDAVSKITELKNDSIDLSLASNKDLELRALQQKQNALDLKQQTLDMEQQAVQKKLLSVEVTANTAKAGVTTLQTGLNSLKRKHASHTCQANTTKATVKKVRTDLGALEAKANTTEDAVKMLQTDLSSLKRNQTDNKTDLDSQIQKVQLDQEKFKGFLQAHNLEQDLSRLSTCIEQHERRITSLEQQSQRSQEGPHEVAGDDITRLQSELVKHYRGGQSLLAPNPVVDEALDLDEIYVRPDIKVLRETSNPRAGLKTVQTNSTAGSASMCKNLFCTDQYQNKQIYVAGNAGMGKTILCKYLVNLWCQTQSDPQDYASFTSKQTVDAKSSTRQDQEQNQEARQSVDLSTSQGFLNPVTPAEQNRESSQYVASGTGSGYLHPGHNPGYCTFTGPGSLNPGHSTYTMPISLNPVHNPGYSQFTGPGSLNPGHNTGHSTFTMSVSQNPGYSQSLGPGSLNPDNSQGYSQFIVPGSLNPGQNQGYSQFIGPGSPNPGHNQGYSQFIGPGSLNPGQNQGYSQFIGPGSLNPGNNQGDSQFIGPDSLNPGHNQGDSQFIGTGSLNPGHNSGYSSFTGPDSLNPGNNTGYSTFTGSGSLNPGPATASLDPFTDEINLDSEYESDTSDCDDFDEDLSENEFWEYKEEQARQWAKETKREEEADKEIILEFHLLFYISLRESSTHYTIADMIDAQILKQIRSLSQLKAADILQNSKCLVIIDGLDEWTCPQDAEIPPFINCGIPGRDLNSNSVFLTTARPWKLDVLRLKGLEIDKHVELCGLNETTSMELCSKYIDFVNKLDGTNRKSRSFWTELKKKGLERLNNDPNLLILLIGLWIDNQELGKSRLQLFWSMLEMLLKRASEKNLPQQRSNDSVTTEGLLPDCFNNYPHCLIHQHLLAHLCKVAFEALLDPKREEALVFNASQLTIFGVNQDGIDLCLKSGILTQDKVLDKRSAMEKKISFLHKQLQEALAAVYLSNRENIEHVTSRVHEFCTTVDSVLELSQVWMFLSGIRPDLARELLTVLMTRVVLNDARLQKYRYNLPTTPLFYSFSDCADLPRSIQTCIVNCVMEARSNGHGDPRLPLLDFIIDHNTISECLEYLVTTNTSAIRSVYIYTDPITDDDEQTVVRIVTQLQHTRRLQALALHDGGFEISDTSPMHKALVNNKDSLTCLELCAITLSAELHAAVCGSLHHITSLSLTSVRLTHNQKEQLMSSVSQTGSMRELELLLNCTEHGKQCRPWIDLSGLTQLHMFSLLYMHVAQLPATAPCEGKVEMQRVTVAESQLRQFIHQLSSTSHSVEVRLYDMTVKGESENPVDLTNLRHNNKLHVTRCDHDDSDNTWTILFSTLQQTTSETGN